MSKSTTTTSEQTQERNPYAPAIPGIERAAGMADRVLNQRLRQDLSPFQQTTDAWRMQTQRATDGSPLVDAAQGNLQSTINGDYLAQGNPYMEGLRQRITADVMPGINATFSRAGRTGSQAHGYALGRGLGDAFAPIEYQNYEAERGRQMQANSMAPSLADYDYRDIGMLANVGAQRDAQRTRVQDRRANALQEYLGTVGAIGSMGGSSSGTSVNTQSQANDPLQTALGLGMMAASPFTGGASMGLGGLAGAFMPGMQSQAATSITPLPQGNGLASLWGY